VIDLGVKVLDGAVAVMMAPACAACSSPLDHPIGGPICEACWSAICPIHPPRCDLCGDPLPSSLSSPAAGPPDDGTGRKGGVHDGSPDGHFRQEPRIRCARCRSQTREVDRGRAVGAYEGVLRDIIHAYKYDGRRVIGRRLGDMLRQQGDGLIDGADMAVPVPLHRRRHHARGFNQARDLANRLGLPVRQVLRRRRATRPQVDLPASERRRNLVDAFVLRHLVRTGACRWRSTRRLLDNAVVVLVDDVSTTGATLDACARVLKAGGVREVRALTVARTIRAGPERRPTRRPGTSSTSSSGF
jgi:ComF family protein